MLREGSGGGSYDWNHILLDFCGKRYKAEESAEV
jgi:hypothetical protein